MPLPRSRAGKSINPDTTEEVDEVVEELKAQKPLVQAYVMDEIFDKMIGGEAAIGVYYSGDAITMIDDNPDLGLGVPGGGQRAFRGQHVHPRDQRARGSG